MISPTVAVHVLNVVALQVQETLNYPNLTYPNPRLSELTN